MTVLVCVTGRDNSKLLAELRALLPNVKVTQWPDCDDLASVEFVLAWKAPSELWSQLPNLKVVQSYGAGVDGIELDKIPEHVKVTRIVDEQLAEDMAEYVLTHILSQKLRLKEYYLKQQQTVWKPKRAYKHNHVGILGMGELGQQVAKRLSCNNFKVSGWSRSEKDMTDVTHYHGQEGLELMLPQVDYLVCLLPLTEQTTGFLNKALFARLAKHCVLINVARGAHLVEADLIAALDTGNLRGATLDVFSEEPLSDSHPFWQHEQITMTPHCAALTSLETVCQQIAYNALAHYEGKALKNEICKQRGY